MNILAAKFASWDILSDHSSSIIFNVILETYFFPTKWQTTVVSELFKNKGVPTDATNISTN